MDDIGEFLFSTFLKYTRNMYNGNEPCGEGHERIDGGKNDRWETKYGAGETYKDKIVNFSFSLNSKVSIFIIGDRLDIVDNRYAGEFDEWCYCNKKDKTPIHGCSDRKMHELEPERIEKYLSTKIPNCKIWRLVQERARELMNDGGEQ